jgi:hypothetical protein
MSSLAKFRQSLCDNPLVKFHLVQHFRHSLQCQLMLSEDLSLASSSPEEIDVDEDGEEQNREEKNRDGDEKESDSLPQSEPEPQDQPTTQHPDPA